MQKQEQPAESAPEPQEAPVLGRCALRPAVSGGDACEKAEDGCAIRGVRRSASTHGFTRASSSYVHI